MSGAAPFQGASPDIPNSIQAIDLGLGLENLHCRPRVRVRVRVTIRVRVRYDKY